MVLNRRELLQGTLSAALPAAVVGSAEAKVEQPPIYEPNQHAGTVSVNTAVPKGQNVEVVIHGDPQKEEQRMKAVLRVEGTVREVRYKNQMLLIFKQVPPFKFADSAEFYVPNQTILKAQRILRPKVDINPNRVQP